MKMQSNTLGKAVSATFLKIAALIILLFNSVVPMSAQAQDSLTSLPKEISVKYAGSNDGEPILRVEFDNREKESLELSISDGDGNILYKEYVKEAKYSKKFQVDYTQFENIQLVLTLTSPKGVARSYQINTSVRTVRDVQVTKL